MIHGEVFTFLPRSCTTVNLDRNRMGTSCARIYGRQKLKPGGRADEWPKTGYRLPDVILNHSREGLILGLEELTEMSITK